MNETILRIMMAIYVVQKFRYPGGWVLAYSPMSGKCRKIAQIANGEGVLSFARGVDGICYCLTWPRGLLVKVQPNGEVSMSSISAKECYR